ncbi:MAG: MBL fold metallo-hydrolase [Clostridiales Family XIII bacterium]|jgi:phosphoribosyl 1,2-cyclic phosphodiesterase|nr:MBL fold metallo-hydrolase [Clostridiales Family XIII bacterium]
MGFDFCSFSSGSSGNCYLVRSECTAVLVDAGISRTRIMEGLARTGTDPAILRALLVTHEHIDHVRGASALLKKEKGIVAFANEKTWAAAGERAPAAGRRNFVTGESFRVGDILVKTFAVNHDAADPVGYTLTHGGRQISIITDTGHVDEEMLLAAGDADILVLEANHDEDMLKYGRYSMALKQRVLGDRGHLSNTAAGNAIVKWLEGVKKERRVLLAHLSRENNFPEMALQTIRNILEEKKYYIGRDLRLDTMARDEIGPVYEA